MTPIELAPNWKRSLSINHPLLATGGYEPNLAKVPSTALPSAHAQDSAQNDPSPDNAPAGALVTLPTTLRARVGAPLPRVIEIPGGCWLRTGAANPGLSHVVREYRRAWEQSAIPIIVAFAAQSVNDWSAMAAQIENVPGVGGIELHFNPTLAAASAIRAMRAVTELPILAKLDLDNAREIAADCIAAGANALVIGRAPRGLSMVAGKPWFGRLYGPAAKPFALQRVAEIRDLKLDAPLIGCGGVHSAEDVREFLAAGACAVEIDSAAWIDPAITARIAEQLDTD